MLDSPFGRFVLRLGPLKGKIGEDEYLAVCQLNEPLVIERNQEGDWEIQSLNGAIDSLRNAALTRAVADWAKKDGTGIGFGAFTGFTLPSGAVRAPDHAWIRSRRRAPVKVLKNAEAISGEPLLRGLTVDLTELWNPSI